MDGLKLNFSGEYIVELRTGVSVQNFSNTFGLQYISPIFGQEYHRVKMAPTMSRKRAAEVAQLAFRPSEGIVWWEPVKYVKYKKYASVEADPAMKAQWFVCPELDSARLSHNLMWDFHMQQAPSHH
jgi:hypothetical protein